MLCRIAMFCMVLLVSAPVNLAAQERAIRVSSEQLREATIDPMLGGQFVEYLCDLVPAMWAEKLYDGSFEGLSRYKFVYLKETDFKEKPWYPSGATNRASVTQDKETRISGEFSKRIESPSGAPATVGISQDGIWAKPDEAMIFSCYMRANSVEKVRVRLHRDGISFAEAEFDPGVDWKKATARLVPSAAVEDATLSIEFRGPGTLWLDSASLMPAQTVGGWRPDVVRATRQLKPAIIRFGGSALDVPELGDFEWRDTIGDPDRRKPFRAWGGLQNPAAGIEEFVQFCRAVDAEPLICVRFTKRTPKDAADQVEYLNGSIDTPMGKLRAQNGHPEPYRVKYWQIGNEIQSEAYDQQLVEFCRAMKEVDPSIVLMASFPTPKVVQNAGAFIDYICPHQYSKDLVAMEEELIKTAEMVRTHSPDRKIGIAVTEWNVTFGDAGPNRAILWSLENALACSRYHNLLHRHCDVVTIANRSNLANSFCSGVIQTDRRGRLYMTPTYYAQQLYAQAAGGTPMKLDRQNDDPLDVSAVRSADGKGMMLFVVNTSLSEQPRTIDLSALKLRSSQVKAFTLADRDRAGEPDVINSFGDPERIAVTESKIEAASEAKLSYTFPAISLTMLKWEE